MEGEKYTKLLPTDDRLPGTGCPATGTGGRFGDRVGPALQALRTGTGRRPLGAPAGGNLREGGDERRLPLTDVSMQLDERWDSLLDCTSDLVVIVSIDSLILHANRMCRTLVSGREDIVGRSICDLLDPEHRVLIRECIERACETGSHTRQIVSFLASDNASSRWDVRIGPVWRGKRTAAAGMFFSDVTDREQMAMKLKESEILLRSIVKAVPKMMDIVDGLVRHGTSTADPRVQAQGLELYHEQISQIGRLIAVGKANSSLINRLPQFLTAIGISVENALARLQAVSCPKSARRDLEAALEGIAGVAGRVERVRGFAKTAAKRNLVHKVDLAKAIRKVVGLLEAHAQVAQTAIIVEDADSLPPVRMAEGDTEQLLFCLIDSMLRSMDGKGPNEIRISCAVPGPCVEIGLSCEPCGAQRDGLDAVSNWLASVEPVGQDDTLGDSVVNEIIAHAGGKIRSKRTALGGRVCFVTLPVDDRVGASLE